jgi:creatinine amidohydrolase
MDKHDTSITIQEETMAPFLLDQMTWPDVQREQKAGHDTLVIAFGATEQHGPHMPLATDALIGDHLAALVADRLEAFVAPTVRVGCSEHHLAFAGTLSLSTETFHSVVADLVRSAAQSGFRRIVLLPTHGGNFAPLAEAIEKLGPVEGVSVSALTDLSALLAIAQLGVEEHGVPLEHGGLHAGEWETSMLEAIHPELVHPDRAQPGYTGDPQAAAGAIFAAGVHTIAENGVIGDPANASPEHGERYWAEALRIVLEAIG